MHPKYDKKKNSVLSVIKIFCVDRLIRSKEAWKFHKRSEGIERRKKKGILGGEEEKERLPSRTVVKETFNAR